MAGSSFFALFDDIAQVMDDVATLSKVATQKTSGVLGDDLALNAEQVTGVMSHRELPVVWAVAKGSLLNKALIVPVVLALSIFLPWTVQPLLMIGGLYLCFEGVEKVLHPLLHKKEVQQQQREHLQHLQSCEQDLLALEKEKIKGAIRTDFILSAEIIVISLGVVAQYPLITRSLVLCGISLLMTVGVYGLVALLVKIDDLGFYLLRKNAQSMLGKFLVHASPHIMRTLSFAGTVAMFLVGGGIVVHTLSWLHHWITGAPWWMSTLFDGATGALSGLLLFAVFRLYQFFSKKTKRS